MTPKSSVQWLKLWVEASRPATLWAAFVPVLVGTALVSMNHTVNAFTACLIFATAGLIQIGTNFVNDYKDAQTGADDEDRLGPRRATASGLIRASTMKSAAAIVLFLATLGGVFLIQIGGWVIAVIGILSILSAIAYTAGPMPLAYVGLGDVFVILFFGVVAVCGTEYVLSGACSTQGLLLGTAVGAVATGILVVNNLRDMHTDVRVGKRTLAVRFGATFTRWEYAFLLALAHACIAAVALMTPNLRGLLILFVITIPWSMYCIRAVWTREGVALNAYLGKTAQLELLMGLGISGVCLWSN
jgi:1,4-dihydroxy-2-naphthoate polyprenyltransferase